MATRWWVEAGEERLELGPWAQVRTPVGLPFERRALGLALLAPSTLRVEVLVDRPRAPRRWLEFVLAHRGGEVALSGYLELAGRRCELHYAGRISSPELAVFMAVPN